MVPRYLQERFPGTGFHFISAGILPHTFCLQLNVLDSGKVDLMFAEASVNGTDSPTRLRDPEGIVRHAGKSNPRMDIVMMSFAGPDAGIVSYRIDHGPTRTLDLYTQWSNSLYVPWYVLFAGGRAKKGKTYFAFDADGQ